VLDSGFGGHKDNVLFVTLLHLKGLLKEKKRHHK
jgi:hypothetical protein